MNKFEKNNRPFSSDRPNKSDRRDRSDNSRNLPDDKLKKSSVRELKPGDYFSGVGKIVRKVIPGPTVLIITDGSGSIDAVMRDCLFDVGDIVSIDGWVSERADKLQIDVERITASELDFEKILDEKSVPVNKEFSIKSEKLTLLRSYFLRISQKIRRAIIDNQPILIRHHADADGIISGLSIEKSAKLFMEEIGINPDYNLYRSPSKAPFYETTDMFRDVSFTKKILEEHGQKKPLIIVLDNGSTPEDVFAMKSLKSLGFDIIVIDHHNPVVMKDKKTSVCPYLLDHLNPYMEGLDGQLTAGMLSYEMARLIHKDFDLPIYPAVSAIGDRSSIQEAQDYISLSGITLENVRKIVIAIDFVAYHLKFDSGKGIYEELFKTMPFVDILNEKVKQGVETQLESTLPYLRTQTVNGIVFSYIDLEKYTLRFTYPTPGKIIGMIHDKVVAENDSSPVFTIGYLSDMIIIRANKPVLPVHAIIADLHKTLPEANVDGGGHECAGTIKFVPAHLSTILENIKQQLRKVRHAENNE